MSSDRHDSRFQELCLFANQLMIGGIDYHEEKNNRLITIPKYGTKTFVKLDGCSGLGVFRWSGIYVPKETSKSNYTDLASIDGLLNESITAFFSAPISDRKRALIIRRIKKSLLDRFSSMEELIIAFHWLKIERLACLFETQKKLRFDDELDSHEKDMRNWANGFLGIISKMHHIVSMRYLAARMYVNKGKVYFE